MIFAGIRETTQFTIIDGYSNNKTVNGALKDLAKEVEKYSKIEANALRDMIKDKSITNLLNVDNGNDCYYIEYSEVSQASRIVNDNENEYKDANYYIMIRFVKDWKVLFLLLNYFFNFT